VNIDFLRASHVCMILLHLRTTKLYQNDVLKLYKFAEFIFLDL